jgi:hypothetical protein
LPRKTTAAKPPEPTPLPLKEWKVGDQASTGLLHITCGGDQKLIQGVVKEIRPCPLTKTPMYKVGGFWFEAWELLLPAGSADPVPLPVPANPSRTP